MINKKLLPQKNIITVGFNADITKSGTGEYNTGTFVVQSAEGTGFSIENGKIKVGPGINKVMINGNVIISCINSTNPATRNFAVRKNGANLRVSTSNTCKGGWLTLSLSPYLIDVMENDVLDIVIYAQNQDVIKGNNHYSYVTISEVK